MTARARTAVTAASKQLILIAITKPTVAENSNTVKNHSDHPAQPRPALPPLRNAALLTFLLITLTLQTQHVFVQYVTAKVVSN